MEMQVLMLTVGVGLLGFGVWCLFFNKSWMMRIIYAAVVFLYTLGMYLYPYAAGGVNVDEFPTMWVYLPHCIEGAIKQFVGEGKMEILASYVVQNPLFGWVYYMALALSLLVTGSAVLLLLYKKLHNNSACTNNMKSKVCDIVVGDNDVAFLYAGNDKDSTIIMPDNAEGNDSEMALVEAGYHVLKRKFDVALFSSKVFRKGTRYNFIIPYSPNKFADYFGVVVRYLETAPKTNFYFYLETATKAYETIQKHVGGGEKHLAKLYGEYVNFFSREELIAQKFTAENPITTHLPKSFFLEDTSVKAEASLRVVMIGYNDLTREIFKQFAINNQFVEYKGGEYVNHPAEYEFYAEDIDENEWGITGIEKALDVLREQEGEYFPIPDAPAQVKVYHEDISEEQQLKSICEKAKDADMVTYFIINTGDVYKNLVIGDHISLLLNEKGNYHMFLYNDGAGFKNGENKTFFGNLAEIFNHEVIVNDGLVRLAKNINKVYTKMYMSGPISLKELEEKSNQDWKGMSYFNKYSNIFLANNFRLKLHLLGLDYAEGTASDPCRLLKERFESGQTENEIDNYLTQSLRNALLAQEHARWNAYFLFSGHLPLEKKRIGEGVNVAAAASANDLKKAIFDMRKNAKIQKHACITTHSGVGEVAKYLAEKTNALLGQKAYTPESYEFYETDDMLLREEVVCEYLKNNGLVIVEKK